MDDFGFLCQLFAKFFSQKRIQNALTKFDDLELSGWEKWWQFELLIYIDNHSDIAECRLEENFQVNEKSEGKQKNKIVVDLSYRRKNYAKNRFTYIELKQANETKKCIRNMLSDVDKLINARPKKSQYGSEIRHINLVGIHPRHEDGITQTKNEIKENVIKRFDDRGYSVYADRIEVKVIPNTPYYCTIF